MPNQDLSDAEAKEVLRRWPGRTNKLWPPPQGRGFWIRGQPKDGLYPGPVISAPGARLFKTQPDGLWIHFNGSTSCDIVAIEVCRSIQNLNDKRSRYIPASHSLILNCSTDWLHEDIAVQKGGRKPRWKATASFGSRPHGMSLPIRHLRVLYSLPNPRYHEWCREHTPTGYEFFCPHSSLGGYTGPFMRAFLRQMSREAHFRVRLRQSSNLANPSDRRE